MGRDETGVGLTIMLSLMGYGRPQQFSEIASHQGLLPDLPGLCSSGIHRGDFSAIVNSACGPRVLSEDEVNLLWKVFDTNRCAALQK